MNDSSNARARPIEWDTSDSEEATALERRMGLLEQEIRVGFEGVNARLDAARQRFDEAVSQMLDLHKRFVILLDKQIELEKKVAVKSRGKK